MRRIFTESAINCICAIYPQLGSCNCTSRSGFNVRQKRGSNDSAMALMTLVLGAYQSEKVTRIKFFRKRN